MRKKRLTEKEEEQRLEGLRILARIIARHHMANPGLYSHGPSEARVAPSAHGQQLRKEEAA